MTHLAQLPTCPAPGGQTGGRKDRFLPGRSPGGGGNPKRDPKKQTPGASEVPSSPALETVPSGLSAAFLLRPSP